MSKLSVSGEFLVDGIKGWFKQDLVNIASNSTDLGKFFFSVSSASIGSFLAITKFCNESKYGILLYLSLILYLCSIIASIILVHPRCIKFNENTDLFVEYDKQYRKTRTCLVVWFSIWLIGTISAVCSLIF